jgi:hypothetical protein
MRAKIYEKYYKLGFDHFVFKQMLGLKKPKKAVRSFYYTLIFLILSISLLLQ